MHACGHCGLLHVPASSNGVLWAAAKCPQKASGCCGRVVGIPAPPHLHLEWWLSILSYSKNLLGYLPTDP